MVGLRSNPRSCSKVAVLVLGAQEGINLSPARCKQIETLTALCRNAGALVIWCNMSFRKCYPEIGEDNLYLSHYRSEGLFETHGEEVNMPIVPYNSDIIMQTVRWDAFIATELDLILRAKKIDTVVVIGAGTETMILHTALHACNLDYRVSVLSDACFPVDRRSAQVLMEKVFPLGATVQTEQEFVNLYRL